MDIIPAVLTNSPEELPSQLSALHTVFNRAQIDIADGVFVPNITLPTDQIVEIIQNNVEGMYQFDFHLMVEDPLPHLISLHNSKLQIDTVFIHKTALQKLNGESTLSQYRFSTGVVLNPEDMVEENLSLLTTFSHLQIMTVYPGFQGSAFLPEMLEKIDVLRKSGYKGKLYVDGGINDQSVRSIAARNNKPDVLCVGSYFTHHLDTLQNQLDTLKRIIS